MVLKLGRFGQQIKNTWEVLKCGAGEGWKQHTVNLIQNGKIAHSLDIDIDRNIRTSGSGGNKQV